MAKLRGVVYTGNIAAICQKCRPLRPDKMLYFLGVEAGLGPEDQNHVCMRKKFILLRIFPGEITVCILFSRKAELYFNSNSPQQVISLVPTSNSPLAL